jgi:hypothetical protein
VISSEYTITQQGTASSAAHACQQHLMSHQLVHLLAAHTPMMGSMTDLHLDLYLDQRSFALQPSPTEAFQSYKHQIC